MNNNIKIAILLALELGCEQKTRTKVLELITREADAWAECPNGGTKRYYGIDDSGEGYLDDEEILWEMTVVRCIDDTPAYLECYTESDCSHNNLQVCDGDSAVKFRGYGCQDGQCVLNASEEWACEFGCANDNCLPTQCMADSECGTEVLVCKGDYAVTQTPMCNVGECTFWESAAVGCEFGCSEGACNPMPSDYCKDDSVCTIDEWSETHGVCLHIPIDCSDGDPCTYDPCDIDNGCFQGTQINCNDYNPDTQDYCDPATGHCNHLFDCNDGVDCTVDTIKSDGTCDHMSYYDLCEDGDVCTYDYCSPATGCKHIQVEAKCEDGNPCSVDDTCTNGTCTAGVYKDCNDGVWNTTDSCNGLTGQCQHEPIQ